MFGDFLGSCENHHFLSQTGEATFWATFGKLGLLFISTSGTGPENILQYKFYATLFFKNFDWMLKLSTNENA